MSETKKRLLLSKWKCGDLALREELEKHEETIAELTWERDDMEAALLAVRDWMHEPLFLGRPMRDPRVILRKVEECL